MILAIHETGKPTRWIAEELLEIAKAYRNFLKTYAHTEGEVATYEHISEVIAKAESR